MPPPYRESCIIVYLPNTKIAVNSGDFCFYDAVKRFIGDNFDRSIVCRVALSKATVVFLNKNFKRFACLTFEVLTAYFFGHFNHFCGSSLFFVLIDLLLHFCRRSAGSG